MEVEFREALKGWGHLQSVLGNEKMDKILKNHGNGGAWNYWKDEKKHTLEERLEKIKECHL